MEVPAEPVSVNPVQLNVIRKDQYSRGLAVLGCLLLYGRIIAAIPILIVLYVFSIIAFIVAWIMQFVVLFTGSYPEGAHTFLTGYLRWVVRAHAFILGLSDKYPTSMVP